MRNVIFSYCNFQINPIIAEYKQMVMDKLLSGTEYEYKFLRYNLPDGQMFPDDVMNYAIPSLFVEGFDNILILDIDCIPLNNLALDYVFEKANQGVLIGNVQRSHYIENNKHLFIGSSCLCLSKTVFDQLGKPNFCPTVRGDIAEEFVYLAEEKNIPIEFFVPHSYEASPHGASEWELDGQMKPYGIGTTFMRETGEETFYHLFESRTNLHVDKFVAKCNEVLNSDK